MMMTNSRRMNCWSSYCCMKTNCMSYFLNLMSSCWMSYMEKTSLYCCNRKRRKSLNMTRCRN